MAYNAGQLGNDWENDIHVDGINITVSAGKTLYGSGTFSIGKAKGDDGVTWYYVGGGAKGGAGLGGGLSFEKVNYWITGSSNAKELEGFSFEPEIGFGTPIIGITLGATTDLKKGGFSIAISSGAELEAHLALGFTYTHIYKKKEEALNKLSDDMKKKKIPKDKIQEALSKAKEKLNE